MHELEWLYDLQRFGSKLGLERIMKIVDLLGNPQNNIKFIHIAGTNGKGSTAAMISSCLQAAGYRTGLYTSPHLVRFNERIKINGNDISDEDTTVLVNKIRNIMEENNINLTFFEFITALAFLYFYEQKVDYVVAEVGLGGRFDATNIITPLVSIITNIDMDHTQILGETKMDIAREKSGVIKKNIPFITSEQDTKIADYFRNLCKELRCPFNYVSKDLAEEMETSYKIGLKGEHQLWNAACAYLVCKELNIPQDAIYRGLANVQWPGRIDIRQWQKHKVIIDSAHNKAGMACFSKYLLENNSGKKSFVIGFSSDKDITGMLKELKKAVSAKDDIFITKSDFKPADVSYVRDIAGHLFDEKSVNIEGFDNAADAVIKALKKEGDIVITGSIYLIGKILQQETGFL